MWMSVHSSIRGSLVSFPLSPIIAHVNSLFGQFVCYTRIVLTVWNCFGYVVLFKLVLSCTYSRSLSLSTNCLTLSLTPLIVNYCSYSLSLLQKKSYSSRAFAMFSNKHLQYINGVAQWENFGNVWHLIQLNRLSIATLASCLRTDGNAENIWILYSWI